MDGEIIFNIEKPSTKSEIEEFKNFRREVKSLLKKGKLKVVEKFSVFAFVITNYTSEEENKVTSFFKNKTIN